MKRQPLTRPVRVGLISLGCAKNLVDAELMLGALLQGGMEITNDPVVADAVIVNTCSFIDAAQEESVDTVLESAALREARHRGQALIVSGCLPQRFRDELPTLFPEVDAFMGIDQVPQVGQIVHQALRRRGDRISESPKAKGLSPKSNGSSPKLEGGTSRSKVPGLQSQVAARLAELDKAKTPAATEASASLRGSDQFGNTRTIVPPRSPEPLVEVHHRPIYIPDYATPRFRLTPRHFAYIKIAEGCNHPCSFCIIPRMRGSHRSRPQGDIVAEARGLLAEGVKELNLISQDTTYYGLDLRSNHRRAIASPQRFTAAARALPADATTLCTLLRDLNALRGDFWIRLLYTHPAHWTDELIQTLAECPKVARYVDLPLQHIHPVMLQRMRRETSDTYIRDLIRRLRAGLPGLTLRTTFIVGFPGETEACFQTLLDFIRETRFERLGVFTYSQEEGTIAGKMTSQVPDPVKRRRRDQAMATQHAIAREVAAAAAGRRIKVLVEGPARAKDLANANIFSWEHGQLREPPERKLNHKPPNAPLGTRAYCVARGEADAPDIDGRVYVRGPLHAGEFATVKVIGHTDYDLLAEPTA